MVRHATMFLKMSVIIIAVGALACALLVIRQKRIEAAHEMSLIHQRLGEHERTLWRLRSEIASACRPERVRRLVKNQGGQWTAIPAPPAIQAPHPPLASPPQRLAEANRPATDPLPGSPLSRGG